MELYLLFNSENFKNRGIISNREGWTYNDEKVKSIVCYMDNLGAFT
jgi:hypothetical protein